MQNNLYFVSWNCLLLKLQLRCDAHVTDKSSLVCSLSALGPKVRCLLLSGISICIKTIVNLHAIIMKYKQHPKLELVRIS
jgi:hypothetical protein